MSRAAVEVPRYFMVTETFASPTSTLSLELNDSAAAVGESGEFIVPIYPKAKAVLKHKPGINHRGGKAEDISRFY